MTLLSPKLGELKKIDGNESGEGARTADALPVGYRQKTKTITQDRRIATDTRKFANSK